jgi:gamma-carbonic anhydrase
MRLYKPFKGVYPKVHHTAFIAETAVLIGDVTIGANSSVWYGCVLRGDVAPIVVGENTNIQDGTVIHTASEALSRDGQPRPTLIGDNVTVGHMALLHACTIESLAFVGMKACVLDGAKVCSGAMLGAGSLLGAFKEVPTDELWVGLPAKFSRLLTQKEQDFLALSAKQYCDLSNAYK